MRRSGSRHRAATLAVLAALAGLGAWPAEAGAAGAPAERGAWVRLRDQRVLELVAPRGDVPPERRAREATAALEAAVAADRRAEPTVELGADGATVRVGAATVLLLGPEDAAAEALPLPDLAGRAVQALRAALQAERRRLAAHDVVYALSMIVFSALLAFLLIRWIGRSARAAAERVEAAETPVRGVTVAGLELVSPPLARGAAAVALRLGRFPLQLAVALAWALSVLSRFEATAAARDRLAAALLEPVVGLWARLAHAVPVALGWLVGVALVALLVRGAGVFFDAVARGETTRAWLPRELAAPAGALVRAAIVLAAALGGAAAFGDDGLAGGLARAAALGLGLAAAPLGACALAGLPLVFGRVLRPGDAVEIGDRRGRVAALGLLAVVLEDERGGRTWVPHLLSLLRPVRVVGRGPEGGP